MARFLQVLCLLPSETESCLFISVQNLTNVSSPGSNFGKSGRIEIPGGVSLITKGDLETIHILFILLYKTAPFLKTTELKKDLLVFLCSFLPIISALSVWPWSLEDRMSDAFSSANLGKPHAKLPNELKEIWILVSA